uniref:Serine/threonine-protein phosphatase BSL3 n=1 Tax=Rhizophora mucronata TaxID=61149 RepID=A0A2P2MSK1_RHIMU
MPISRPWSRALNNNSMPSWSLLCEVKNMKVLSRQTSWTNSTLNNYHSSHSSCHMSCPRCGRFSKRRNPRPLICQHIITMNISSGTC